MELKKYQKNVINDLSRYLYLLNELHSPAKAYNKLWKEKGILTDGMVMPAYNTDINGVPHVCIKVPTGGGKTYIAANAIKPIFDSIPSMHAKAVVWLVPSDSILTQTLNNLSDTNHPYRQRIDVDFMGNVEVYSKSQLLSGQNFNPTTVAEQLSIFVLSYDSFRTNKKEGRKAYQQNGYLAPFSKMAKDSNVLLENTDETALIQIIRSLNPIVIVDESHHAVSDLSVEMLNNFNPCFVLDLTATPKTNSNIISFVDAIQLKKENMVKLPVIVYNRKSQNDVYMNAINIRRKLEIKAKKEQEKTGRYIRPIVLFQAQPRNNGNSTTYEKIKRILIDCGISESHIAIKTADKDELKNINLMSPDCHIRYIITVNALKEGWDCPFAYVLATVANRSSIVDVEQILGRVLRLPYTKKNPSDVLNLSYVITSSDNFNTTLEKVVEGLNNAGFSRNDYRTEDNCETNIENIAVDDLQMSISSGNSTIDDVSEVDIQLIKQSIQMESNYDVNSDSASIIENDELLSQAVNINKEYENEINNLEETSMSSIPQDIRSKVKIYHINDKYAAEINDLKIPQFVINIEPNFFSTENYKLLSKDDLNVGFTLKDKDLQIDFTTISAEMARIDIDEQGDSDAKAWKLTGVDSTYFKEWFNSQPSKKRLSLSKEMIRKKLSGIDGINDSELNEYIDRIVGTMTEDQISDFEQSPFPYINKINEKVKSLLNEHRIKLFNKWLEQDKIQCMPSFQFKQTISPALATSVYPNSLYTAEDGDLNKHEKKVIFEISSRANVKWWHRNISRREFQINGAVHAYPDFIVMLDNGKILMVEPKGDDHDNYESKEKAKLGAKWAELSGKQYKYYMVFETKQPDYQGAYSFERFMEILRDM